MTKKVIFYRGHVMPRSHISGGTRPIYKWKVLADFGGYNFTEFRFESPISISRINNH